MTLVYGLDEPGYLAGEGLEYVCEHEMTPKDLVDRLQGMERRIFRGLYAGSIAKKMYRLYEYGGGKRDDQKG